MCWGIAFSSLWWMGGHSSTPIISKERFWASPTCERRRRAPRTSPPRSCFGVLGVHGHVRAGSLLHSDFWRHEGRRSRVMAAEKAHRWGGGSGGRGALGAAKTLLKAVEDWMLFEGHAVGELVPLIGPEMWLHGAFGPIWAFKPG